MEEEYKANDELSLEEKYILSTLSPDSLELILYPTEQCNFRCVYCYEDFLLGRMDDAVRSGVESLMRSSSDNLNALSISWFGGEPLLAVDDMIELSSLGKRLMAEKGGVFSSSATTNGYLLTEDNLEKLVRSGVNRFQISLDGFGESHNETRILANGEGTFDVIWENLSAAARTDLDFNILLRIHITKNNVDSIKFLLKELDDNFFEDKRFNLFIKFIEVLGGDGAQGAQEVTVSGASRSNVMKDLEGMTPNYLKRQREQLDKSGGGDGLQIEPPPICYAARPNSYAIRADGRIQKCTVHLDDDRNTLGYLKNDGTMEVDHKKFKLWARGYEYGNLNELACPANNMPRLAKDRKFDENLVKVVEL